MNLDRTTAPANGSPSGVGYLSPSLVNGNALKPGGFPLLRMPVVVVPNSVSFVHPFSTFSFSWFVTFAESVTVKQVTSQETSLAASCRRVYAHAHDYHINSISNNRFCTSVTLCT